MLQLWEIEHLLVCKKDAAVLWWYLTVFNSTQHTFSCLQLLCASILGLFIVYSDKGLGFPISDKKQTRKCKKNVIYFSSFVSWWSVMIIFTRHQSSTSTFPLLNGEYDNTVKPKRVLFLHPRKEIDAFRPTFQGSKSIEKKSSTANKCGNYAKTPEVFW